MFTKWVRICDEGEIAWSKYKEKLSIMSPEELISEFLSYLDYVEETDSGREFHPVTIGSCRIMLHEPLQEVLNQFRKFK